VVGARGESGSVLRRVPPARLVEKCGVDCLRICGDDWRWILVGGSRQRVDGEVAPITQVGTCSSSNALRKGVGTYY
jgi:hypothetical protein